MVPGGEGSQLGTVRENCPFLLGSLILGFSTASPSSYLVSEG